jgi:hypothetical protein
MEWHQLFAGLRVLEVTPLINGGRLHHRLTAPDTHRHC